MIKNYFLFILCLLVFTRTAHAQSFTFGMQLQGKSTWLVNTAVLGATAAQEVKPSFGWTGGVTATVYFQQQVDTYFGVGADILFGNHSQRYSGAVSGSPTHATYNSRVNLVFIDVPVYGKLVTRYGAYIEAGVQVSLLAMATYRSRGGLEQDLNVAGKFAPYYIAPLFGVGTDFPLTDDIYFIAGLRFVYGVSNLKGVDGQGNDINMGYAGSKTHAAFLALNLGIYYRFDLGKYGRTGRHRR